MERKPILFSVRPEPGFGGKVVGENGPGGGTDRPGTGRGGRAGELRGPSSEMRPDINPAELIQPEEIADIVRFLVTRKGNGTLDELYIRRYSGLAFD